MVEEKPVGFVQPKRVCIIEAGESAEILGLVVSARARRTGVGRSLLAEVEKWARDIGVGRVAVRSNAIRKESHIFYPAMGLQESEDAGRLRETTALNCFFTFAFFARA